MKNIGININSSKDIDGKILNSVIDIVNKEAPSCNMKIFKDSLGLNCEKTKDMNFIVSLGGDGTILSTLRAIEGSKVPILGVNIGHLGFLTSVEISELRRAIKHINDGEFCIETRDMLECEVEFKNEKKIFNVLNDVVVTKGTLSKIINFDISINGNLYNNFTADGVIVSTSTGSTAYSLSAGGPIIYPSLCAIAITPICPLELTAKAIILDNKSEIYIHMSKKDESAFLSLDGQKIIELNEIDIVKIRSSKWKCNLIRLNDYDYFDILRRKIIFRTKQ